MIVCEWFALCTNEATLLVAHPAIAAGVPCCQRCADKLGLVGEPLANVPYL